MNTQTQLSTNLLRRLALMQHLGEEYFILDGIAYEGNKKDALIQYADYVGDFDKDEEEDIFEEWASQNLPEVEELDENDYGIDYMVLTDEEADVKWEESLDNYLEECVYPDLPENMRYYFDDEKWKRDARIDGRGHSLSSYDGSENEEWVEGMRFYIYRTN